MGRRTNLADLLMAIFNRHELARFLDEFPDGEELLGQLPEGPASRLELASAAAEVLIRRGHAEHDRFWATLAAHRPNKRRRIAETRRRHREWVALPTAAGPWRGRRFMASCLVGSGLLALVAFVVVHWRTDEMQRAWLANVTRTRRIPALILPARSSERVREMFESEEQAREAYARGEYHTALAELRRAEAAAEALVSRPVGARPASEADRRDLHNLAVVLEQEALIEGLVGSPRTAQMKRGRAYLLREDAMLSSQGDPGWTLRLAQMGRREALVAMRDGDIGTARTALTEATRVLEHARGRDTDERVRGELRELEQMRELLAIVAWEPGSDEHMSRQIAPKNGPGDSCRAAIEEGEAALGRDELFAAEDAFAAALDSCGSADSEEDMLALVSTWEGVSACVQALGSEDEEVRRHLLAEILATEPGRSLLPAWALDSWERAWALLTDCREQAADRRGDSDEPGSSRSRAVEAATITS